MPSFSPPVANTRPPTSLDYRYRDPYTGCDLTRLGLRLFGHLGAQPQGRTVLKIDGEYVTVDEPSQTQVDAASEVYLGGHVYDVSASVAAALVAAGFSVG